MPDVFISYSSTDREWVKNLASALETYSLDVWWDPEIKPGQDYRKVIQHALDETKCVIVIWSKDSTKSLWVQAEATQAINRNILIPVSHDNVRIPMPFGSIQTANMEGWSGDTSDENFKELLSGISLHCKGVPSHKNIINLGKNSRNIQNKKSTLEVLQNSKENIKQNMDATPNSRILRYVIILGVLSIVGVSIYYLINTKVTPPYKYAPPVAELPLPTDQVGRDDSDKPVQHNSLFQKIQSNFKTYESISLSIKAPDVVQNGSVIPITINVDESEKGEILFYTNEGDLIGKLKVHSNIAQYYLATRIKMLKTGYIYVLFSGENGKIVANRKYINVSDAGVIKSTNNVALGKFKIRTKNGTLKMLNISDMSKSNYIKSIEFSNKGIIFTTLDLSPYMSKNPYVSIKYNKSLKEIQVNVTSNKGEIKEERIVLK